MALKKVFHLPGGIRAVYSNLDEVLIIPGLNITGIKYSLPQPEFLLPSLLSLKLIPIGFDSYTSQGSLKGYEPPLWFPIHINYPVDLITFQAEDTWSCITFSAITENNFELADISRRITFEIRATSFRLRELSNSYWKELKALCKQNIFSPGKKIRDYPIGTSRRPKWLSL